MIDRSAWRAACCVFGCLLGVVAAGSGCTKSQGAKCTADSECTNPAYPFCDVNGEFPASGGDKNVCTIVPPDCPVERCGCSAGATTCTSDKLSTCNADGKSVTTSDCALGCATDGTRCLGFDPSNGLGAALTAAGSEPAITIPDGATINTDTGVVKNSGGITIPVTSLAVSQGATTIRALLGGSFSIGDVTVTGTSPLAIVAVGDVNVMGILDASANATDSGPGAQLTGTCIGQTSAFGGGGGGNATAGGKAGQPNIATDPRARGGAAQTAFEPLVGGCVGGGLMNSSESAPGGGGGGALQIVSLGTIIIGGGINVGGGGGGTDGGGGGSGGLVILEAPHVMFSAATSGIFASGGSGGACSASGVDASADGNAVPGPGPCGSGLNTVVAGAGGTATTMAGDGSRGSIDGGAGGGGSVGRVRVATRDGTYDGTDAVLDAAVTTAQLTTH